MPDVQLFQESQNFEILENCIKGLRYMIEQRQESEKDEEIPLIQNLS